MIRYIDALELIKKAAESGVLQYGNDKNHVLVYHSQGKHHPEGWFAVDLDYAAKDLMNNKKAFELLQEKIQEKLDNQTLDEKIKSNTNILETKTENSNDDLEK